MVCEGKRNVRGRKNVKLIRENVVERVKGVKEEDGKEIWLVGGGEVIRVLVNEDLVDEMEMWYIGVILGNGIGLLGKEGKE